MKERYIACEVVAQTETDLAFCGRGLTFTEQTGTVEHKVETDLWIPKSVIDPEGLDAISDAARGDRIEIYVAQWWLEDNT